MPIVPPARFRGTAQEQLSQCYRYLFSLSERLNQALSPETPQISPEVPERPKDFVVEEGKKDLWAYRLWHSGRAELWGTLEGTADIRQRWGNLFSGPQTLPLGYPFRFSVPPRVVAALEASGCVLASGNSPGTERATPSWLFVRPAAAAVPYRLHVYVLGNLR